MLPRTCRLKAKRDFRRVLKTGKIKRTSFLVIRFADNGLEKSRLGILASARIFRKAVQRSRVKRRLREGLKTVLSRLVPGKDIIVSARAGMENQSLVETKNRIFSLLKEANLVK
jgi:ribonuclease P protein component